MPDPTRNEVAAYIADLLAEMIKLAGWSGLGDLAYFMSMAFIVAEDARATESAAAREP